MTAHALLKFEAAAPPGAVSRCQHWKYSVWPGFAENEPVGVGSDSGLNRVEIEPEEPVFRIEPPTTRPIVPPRHSVPWEPPGAATKPPSREARKYPKTFVGRSEQSKVRVFSATTAEPRAAMRAGRPEAFGVATQRFSPGCSARSTR